MRFGIVGGTSGLIQLCMLILLKSLGLSSVLAYDLGLCVSLQFNFAMNTFLVWGDRPIGNDRVRAFLKRWVTFHIVTAPAILLNSGIFTVAQYFMPDFIAAIVAILGSTLVKFFSLDRLAFKAEGA